MRTRSAPAIRSASSRSLVEALGPVRQRRRVVGREVLDVVAGQAGALEREQDPRQLQRRRVGEDVALGELARLGVAVAQARDAVVEQRARRASACARSWRA